MGKQRAPDQRGSADKFWDSKKRRSTFHTKHGKESEKQTGRLKFDAFQQHLNAVRVLNGKKFKAANPQAVIGKSRIIQKVGIFLDRKVSDVLSRPDFNQDFERIVRNRDTNLVQDCDFRFNPRNVSPSINEENRNVVNEPEHRRTVASNWSRGASPDPKEPANQSESELPGEVPMKEISQRLLALLPEWRSDNGERYSERISRKIFKQMISVNPSLILKDAEQEIHPESMDMSRDVVNCDSQPNFFDFDVQSDPEHQFNKSEDQFNKSIFDENEQNSSIFSTAGGHFVFADCDFQAKTPQRLLPMNQVLNSFEQRHDPLAMDADFESALQPSDSLVRNIDLIDNRSIFPESRREKFGSAEFHYPRRRLF